MSIEIFPGTTSIPMPAQLDCPNSGWSVGQPIRRLGCHCGIQHMSQTGNTKKVAEPIYEEISVDKGIKEKIMRTSRSGLRGARKRLQTLIL